MIDPDLWKDFLKHRRTLRKPLNASGAARMHKRLEALTGRYNVSGAIQNSIECGWAGVLQPQWDNAAWLLTEKAGVTVMKLPCDRDSKGWMKLCQSLGVSTYGKSQDQLKRDVMRKQRQG